MSLATWFYQDWVIWPALADLQHTLKGTQGGDQEWGTLCCGKTGRTGLQIAVFRRKFYEPQFLHLLILRKTLKPLTKMSIPGLPWWCSGWESACQCRGHGFEPWSGKIPHAAEQLGPWATISEPACLEPVLRNKRGRDSEGPAHRDEEWPPLATTRESPRTETKTQHSHK